jgi:hypothetical protein
MKYTAIERHDATYELYGHLGASKIAIHCDLEHNGHKKFKSKDGVEYDLTAYDLTIELCPEIHNLKPHETTIEYKAAKDAINPDHYRQGGIECITALEAATVNKKGIEAVCTANVIKYLWRYEAKNGLEDVKKAKWYLEKLIQHLSSDT